MVVYKKKEKNANEEEKKLSLGGDRYSYVAIDAVSRFIISVASGRRIQKTADQMLRTLKHRICCQSWSSYCVILFTSDNWDQYLKGLKKIFGFHHRPRRKGKNGRKKTLKHHLPWNFLYAIVEKIKNSKGKVIKVIRKIESGEPTLVDRVIEDSSVSRTINTSFVERLNGTFRSFCSRFVRKTYGFSKLSSYHDAHVRIVTAFYNFVHPHSTLTKLHKTKTSPAMAAGITDHCWSFIQLCNFPVASI